MTNKIIDYAMVNGNGSAPSPEYQASSLAYRVRCRIKEGWQPYGHPYQTSSSIHWQAMVKYEEEPQANG